MPSLMSALPPLNWQRVPSCEDNSVLVILCISAGEFNHLPALFTCHLSAEANGPTAKCVQRACRDTLPWLISVSLGVSIHDRSSPTARERSYVETIFDPHCGHYDWITDCARSRTD